MSRKKYVVDLSGDEREHLKAVISKGKSAARTILKARILLKADQGRLGEGWTDDRICQALETNETMVARVRRQLVEQGVTAVLARKKRETPPIQPNGWAGAQKKRSQTAPKQILGHSAHIERGFRGRDGRCSGGLHPSP